MEIPKIRYARSADGTYIASMTFGSSQELSQDDLAGLGAHAAARVSAAGDSEVWTSSNVKDLTAGSGLLFEDAGEHELKGVSDTWRLYRVVA